MFGLGASEVLMLAILGVLLFGRRLPEVGRSLGKTVMEFKKGLSDVENEFHSAFREAEHATPSVPSRPPEWVEPRAENSPQTHEAAQADGKSP